MAFRKRLKKRGYTDIHIKQVTGWEAQWKRDTYKIRATEPLNKQEIRTEYTIEQMNNTFR